MVFGGVGGEEPQSQIGLECFFRGPVPHVLHPRSLHLLNILGSIRDHIFDRSFGNRQAIRLGRNNKSFTNNRISISNHHVASSSRKLEKDISLDKIRFQPTSDEIGPVFPPIIYYKAKKIYVCLRSNVKKIQGRLVGIFLFFTIGKTGNSRSRFRYFIFKISGKPSFVEAVLRRVTQFFYLPCSQSRQKASG